MKWCVSVPKLVLRDMNDASRLPPGLCPITSPATLSLSSTASSTTTGNRPTVTGSGGVDSGYHLHANSASPAPPATEYQPSQRGRSLTLSNTVSLVSSRIPLFLCDSDDTLDSFLAPVAGTGRLAPENRRVCHLYYYVAVLIHRMTGIARPPFVCLSVCL